MKFRVLSVGVLALSLLALPHAVATSTQGAKSVTGEQGQILKVSRSVVKNNTKVFITGAGFDESVGIYVGYCLMPKSGEAPTPCGGGINKKGMGDSSFWISSNPPPYGIGLAAPFAPGGRFNVSMQLTKRIGAFDCSKVRCAVTVRADHLRSEDRSFDLFIPITIKN
jgi:hypothetical protein